MIYSGLTSNTFRQLSPEAVIELAAECSLHGIEWAGDVHVQPGDTARGREVSQRTRQAGLRVAAYGSYYRCGVTAPDAFTDVLASAQALAAPVIRVWAGDRGPSEADTAFREAVQRDLSRIAEASAREGIRIALEYHRNTLTETPEDTVALLQAVASPALGTLWQVDPLQDPAKNRKALESILPWLEHLHVFHRSRQDMRICLPLGSGSTEWTPYLQAVAGKGRDTYALLEFVRDNDPEAFREDARDLRGLLESFTP